MLVLKRFRYPRTLNYGSKLHIWKATSMQTIKTLEMTDQTPAKTEASGPVSDNKLIVGNIFPAPRVVPMLLNNKEPIVLPFDDVPGPKALKYLSVFRNYLSEIGTQITAGVLTLGFNVGTLFNKGKTIRSLSTLFDEYGPVVRFASPVGGDIVLLNHPDHIQKVFSMEGEYPVRSTLESLEKYRIEHKNHVYGGLYTVHGQEWIRQRSLTTNPVHTCITEHAQGIYDICDRFTHIIYNIRNYQDEMSKDLYKELHKWAFDCMGLIMFSKKFSILETQLVYSQCDASWMYHSLERATDAIVKCETGLRLWKLFTTPAWYTLVKYCDSLDSLIGKLVLEIEQEQSIKTQGNNDDFINYNSITSAMLLSEDRLRIEDIATILLDMMLIGVNTITSSMAFLLYNIARHQQTQRVLYQEISELNWDMIKDNTLKENTPYLQACIKETLSIPRGTLIIMSTQDSSLKECNFDDANRFCPERWLRPDSKDYHLFASIPFGYGARKCLGQNVAESMMSLLTIKVLQKYKLEYHYGDVEPTKTFIVKPNRPLKIRFIDRM